MFDKIKEAITLWNTTKIPAPPPAVPDTDVLGIQAAAQGSRAELIEIKVSGMDQAKQNAVWITRGLDRRSATCVRLVDCTSDHLKAIVANKPDLTPDYRRVIESILEDRGETLPDPDYGFTS